MEWTFSEDLELIRAAARDFAEREVLPFRSEWDENQTLPREALRKLGELGMLGVLVPESYGGAGLGYAAYKTIVEELARICGGFALSVAAHNSLCVGHILAFGSEAQKQRWLPALASGAHLGAWGLTEANTGSDAMRMRCTAVRDAARGGWVLQGTKNWITHGISSDVAVVLARTGEPLDSKGITAFVIERGTPGFSGGKKENKLGMRCSETAELIFDACFVPDDQVLGEVGAGFQQA